MLIPLFVQRALWAFLLAYSLAALLAPAAARAQIQLKLGGAATQPSDTVTTPRVKAQLVVLAPQGIAPGQPLMLGLRIEHQPHWHTYWKNPGDSGLPTQLAWQLPQGLSAGDIQWPTPQQLRVGDMLNYGYEGTVLLPVPVTVGNDFTPDANGDVTLRLHASWLVCRVECIPEEGNFVLQLPAVGSQTWMASEFEAALAAQPQALPGAQAQIDSRASGDRITLRVSGLPAKAQGHTLAVFPESTETLRHAAVLGTEWQQSWDGNVWTAELPLHDMRGTAPAAIDLVLATAGSNGEATARPVNAWRVQAAVNTPWQAVELASVSPALAAALAANAQAAAQTPATPVPNATAMGWVAALVGGVLGGLILNLMPCVFPVLAIKLLGIAQHSAHHSAQRASGWAYAAGVILSFVALGALLLALRAAGEQLGWGFQLQNPLVVAGLALLFTLIGLNLAGLFEVHNLLPSKLANARARSPVADAFLSGVLAVAIASPCTAPFMGASLGFAVGMPAAQALAVFAALGVGMALPYVLVSLLPSLVRWLPRPGAWMDTFRRAMAFPMFATVVWLVWVLGQQSGIDGAATLLALLVLAAALAWALTLRGTSRIVLTALLVAATAWFAHSQGRNLTTEPASATAPTAGALWQPWTAAQQQALLAQGQPVFVDYTAAWCVTCQYNKRNALAEPAVLAAFAQRNVALLRADWTRRDPAITEALVALGRSGVPVYVLLAPGQAPVVLSELLSVDEVLAALQAL